MITNYLSCKSFINRASIFNRRHLNELDEQLAGVH